MRRFNISWIDNFFLTHIILFCMIWYQCKWPYTDIWHRCAVFPFMAFCNYLYVLCPDPNQCIINPIIYNSQYCPVHFTHVQEVNLTNTLGPIRTGVVPMAAHYDLLLAIVGAYCVDTVKAWAAWLNQAVAFIYVCRHTNTCIKTNLKTARTMLFPQKNGETNPDWQAHKYICFLPLILTEQSCIYWLTRQS